MGGKGVPGLRGWKITSCVQRCPVGFLSERYVWVSKRTKAQGFWKGIVLRGIPFFLTET